MPSLILRAALQTGQPSSIPFDQCKEKGKNIGDAVNAVVKSESKCVSNMTGTMMGACGDDGAGVEGTSEVAWARTGE